MKLKNLLILLFISIVATASAQLKDQLPWCAIKMLLAIA